MLLVLDGQKIFNYLLDNAMTSKAFCEKSGVSMTALRQALGGEKVRIPTAAKIAKAINCKVEDLIIE